ncbi:MAG: Fn3-like domain-containing protein [Bacillus sp. (in: Bacteria)]|nr:Fn3-like domain-containing protein [Bacillus sp. (in: firmicutes)]
MVQIDKAIEATTRVEPGKLSLGDSKNGPVTNRITISNNGSSAVTYELSHTPALSTGPNTFSVGATTGFAEVSFSRSSVTIPAGRRATVDVTVTANPSLADGSQYGGYIKITGGDQTYRVPYAGFKGDYQSITAMNPTEHRFPWLASLSGDSYVRAEDGPTFTLTDDDIPYVLLHLSHQASKVRIEVRDANTGRNWHRVLDTRYMGRNSTSTGFFAFPFDGTTFAGNGNRTLEVPNGNYVLEVSVLKALGDERNPDHWETWTSPSFIIDRQ